LKLKVFIDSDIIIDLLAQRDPYYEHAAYLFSLIDRQKVHGYTSPLIFANLHYILKKHKSNAFALRSLRKLKTLIGVLPIDERIIEQSLNSDFHDFEDAMQYYTALNNGINIILTRNINDYKSAAISVSTADQFIKMWLSQAKKRSNR
jgi:predicted nucleic acid-binding protein